MWFRPPSSAKRQAEIWASSSQVGPPQPGGEVGSGGGDDHEITVGNDGSSFHEVPGLADRLLAASKAVAKQTIRQLPGPEALFQRQPAGGRLLDHGDQCGQGKQRPPPQGRFLHVCLPCQLMPATGFFSLSSCCCQYTTHFFDTLI